MNEEVKEQLADAASHTTRAYAVVRRCRQPEGDAEQNKTGVGSENKSSVAKTAGLVGGSNVASNEVMLMKPIMRFLQLVCENHNRDLQVSVSGNCDIRCGEKSK